MKFLVLCLSLSLMSVGCGFKVKTGVSPVADIANAGGKIEDSGQAIFQATIKARAASPTIVSQQAADDVAIAVNHLGHAGLDLNVALTAYNVAKAAGGDLALQKFNVQKELNIVNQFLTDIGKALPAGTLQAVDLIVTTVLQVIADVKVGVGL